jgi:hypothetical protein
MENFNLKKFLAEGKLLKETTGIEAIDYTIRILNNFKRVKPFDVPTILNKLESLKKYIEDQYDTQEIGPETAYIELEDLEDALNNNEDITTAIDNTISNLSSI